MKMLSAISTSGDSKSALMAVLAYLPSVPYEWREYFAVYVGVVVIEAVGEREVFIDFIDEFFFTDEFVGCAPVVLIHHLGNRIDDIAHFFHVRESAWAAVNGVIREGVDGVVQDRTNAVFR